MQRSMPSRYPLVFLTVYLAMLSGAPYFVFVDVSDLNNVGKATESMTYVTIWLALYGLLIVNILQTKLGAVLPSALFAATLVLVSFLAYVLNGVEISSVVRLLSLAMTILFGGWAADRFSSEQVLRVFFVLAIAITAIHLLLYPLLGNADFAIVYDRLQRDTVLGTKPYAGVFPHKNIAATFFVQAIVIGIGSALSPGGRWTYGLIANLGLFVIAVLLAGAVSPILSGALSVAVMVIALIYVRAPTIATMIGGGIVLVIAALVLFPDTWLALFNRDSTFTGRTYLYETWFSYFWDKPIFGYGYGEAFNGNANSLGEALNGGTGLWYSQYQNFESGLLQALIEFGVIGGLAYGAAFIGAGRFALRASLDRTVSYALAPLGIATYCFVSSLNEILVVTPNNTTLFLLSFLYAKGSVNLANLESARRASSRRHRSLDRTFQNRNLTR